MWGERLIKISCPHLFKTEESISDSLSSTSAVLSERGSFCWRRRKLKSLSHEIFSHTWKLHRREILNKSLLIVPARLSSLQDIPDLLTKINLQQLSSIFATKYYRSLFIHLLWVPSRRGILANGQADLLAKTTPDFAAELANMFSNDLIHMAQNSFTDQW